ncbi:MAG TPA: Hsp20/alpha crystallin family protein [Caldilineae bacterium]|jgi:HSP20 family protein|nr:Hsp20/alpha crystallin family protein [Caldilineae bacterium]
MTNLMRWDPFRDFISLRNAMDRLFEEAFVMPSRLLAPTTEWSLALDVAEDEDNFIVKATIPGVRPEDLDVSIADNVLTIRGEIKADEEIKEEQYHIRERRYGSFSRSVRLPAPVDADKVEATYENGVLTLRIPKAEEVRPKRIPVKTRQMIEGQASEVKEDEQK